MCVAVHVDWGRGGARGATHNFLKGRFFSMGIFVLYELKCKFLCSETVFCIVIGRQGFHDSAGMQDFAGGQDLSGVLGELYIL